MLILVIYFILLKEIKGYSQASQYLRDTETGMILNNLGIAITTIADTYVNGNYHMPTWTKNFQNAF